MTILNPIICGNCNNKLQSEDIQIGITSNGDLIRVCSFCGDDCRKLVDVADLILNMSPITFMTLEIRKPEIAQPQNVKIDINKIKSFGYNPKIKIEEGITRLIKFYLTEGKKWIE